ncbi:MAG: type II secretion system protein, partial [Acidiferrobacterales bacterium]
MTSIILFIGQNKPSVSIRRFSGFTLVELITTLVIAGV